MIDQSFMDVLEKRLSTKRFEHSLRVLETAMELQKATALSQDKVYIAALLHDIAKDLPPQQLLDLAVEQELITCLAEEAQPDLLHGPVGAYLCRTELGITDQEILDAIRYHTTGRARMSELEIIVYMADLLEPGRTYQGVKELREVSRLDLNRGLLLAFDYTLRYVLERKFLIHHLTIEARNWLLLEGQYEQ